MDVEEPSFDWLEDLTEIAVQDSQQEDVEAFKALPADTTPIIPINR